jgi:uncharacterized membrane protein
MGVVGRLLVAMVVMILASRYRSRPAWQAGAVLLAAVVIKLFLVDLAGVGAIARIVSFLVVGGLLLLLGYLSPMPPKAWPERASDDRVRGGNT